MRSLNRLKWLHAFEATARHGSFTGAAQELGVTPAAVGQLVRSLEDWVGHPLLRRTRSGKERLTLVDEAQDALQDITQGQSPCPQRMPISASPCDTSISFSVTLSRRSIVSCVSEKRLRRSISQFIINT